MTNILSLHPLAVEYLGSRGISRELQEKLNIRWVSKGELVRDWGYSAIAVSNDGGILFPFPENERTKGLPPLSCVKNFYVDDTPEAHLKRIQKRDPSAKKAPKYLQPKGTRNHPFPYYAPMGWMDDASKPILVTEDVIGVVKAAGLGLNIWSSFGTWLCRRKSYKDWIENHELDEELFQKLSGIGRGEIPAYFTDNDCYTNQHVFRSQIRNGATLECLVGTWPEIPNIKKVGLDEAIDAGLDIKKVIKENSRTVTDFVVEGLPIARGRIGRKHPNNPGIYQQRFIEFILPELAKDLGKSAWDLYLEKELRKWGLTKLDWNRATKNGAIATTDGFVPMPFTCYQDEDGLTWADWQDGEIRRTAPIESGTIKNAVRAYLYSTTGEGMSDKVWAEEKSRLIGKALSCGDIRKVNRRIAKVGDRYYLNLGNGRVARVWAGNWDVVLNPDEVRFQDLPKSSHIPIPVKGGKIDVLWEILGIEDEDDRLCILTFLITALIPDIPLCVLGFQGDAGTAKSTRAEHLKRLIDPQTAPLIQLPKAEDKFAAAARNRHVLVYDNVSSISDFVSDIICRISTGFGFSTRTLFTTMDESVCEVRCAQIITAIDALITRGDLASRCFLVNLPKVENRKTLADVEKDFQRKHPEALGAILTLFSHAIPFHPNVKKNDLPRMADFAQWGRALTESCDDLHSEDFVTVFNRKIEEASRSIVEASNLAQRLIKLMNMPVNTGGWKGTAEDLLKDLNDGFTFGTTYPPNWPKGAAQLSRRLKRLSPDLLRIGITIESFREGNTRKIRVETHSSGG